MAQYTITIPADFPYADAIGRTVTGDKRMVPVQGKPVLCLVVSKDQMGLAQDGSIRIDNKPWLIAEIARQDAEAEDKFCAALAGIRTLEREINAHRANASRSARAFDRMMSDEGNDGCHRGYSYDAQAGEAHIDGLRAKFPRAALYLAAQDTIYAAHWADNLDKSAAAKKAQEILLAGGSIDDAIFARDAWKSNLKNVD